MLRFSRLTNSNSSRLRRDSDMNSSDRLAALRIRDAGCAQASLLAPALSKLHRSNLVIPDLIRDPFLNSLPLYRSRVESALLTAVSSGKGYIRGGMISLAETLTLRLNRRKIFETMPSLGRYRIRWRIFLPSGVSSI
jgi:hypothetical protein